jgi:CheY-like chemotaxis protein
MQKDWSIRGCKRLPTSNHQRSSRGNAMYLFGVDSTGILPSTSQSYPLNGQREPSRAIDRELDVKLDEKPRALVIDDAPDIAEMLALMLRTYGYEAETSYSASEAVVAADEQHFDLIISDISMPKMDGYELARRLRSKSEYEGVPMIAVTGLAEVHDREKALKAGFNAYLTKPVDCQKLLLMAGIRL